MCLKLLGTLAILFLYGCTTIGQNQNQVIGDLENRLTGLEDQLSEQDDQVKMLSQDLENLQRREVVPALEVKSLSPGLDAYTTTDIQRALKSAGFYEGAVDGKIGAKTKEAITAFQEANGLKSDGKVGPLTWATLRKYLR